MKKSAAETAAAKAADGSICFNNCIGSAVANAATA